MASPSAPVQQGTIRSIHVSGLSDEGKAELLASLPIHEGGEWNADTAQKASQAVKAFDEHLVIVQQVAAQSAGGEMCIRDRLVGEQHRCGGRADEQGALRMRRRRLLKVEIRRLQSAGVPAVPGPGDDVGNQLDDLRIERRPVPEGLAEPKDSNLGHVGRAVDTRVDWNLRRGASASGKMCIRDSFSPEIACPPWPRTTTATSTKSVSTRNARGAGT